MGSYSGEFQLSDVGTSQLQSPICKNQAFSRSQGITTAQVEDNMSPIAAFCLSRSARKFEGFEFCSRNDLALLANVRRQNLWDRKSVFRRVGSLERETELEPATLSLGS